MSINSRLSKELQVYPMGDDHFVTYRLLGEGVELSYMQDDEGNKKLATPRVSLPGECFITDPYAKNKYQKVHLVHAEESETIQLPDGTTQLKPISKRVVIDSKVTFNASLYPEKYAYLERYPQNASNPFRDKNKKPIFERVDVNKIKRDNLKKTDIIDTAISILREATEEEILNIAKHINRSLQDEANLNIDQEIQLLRSDIRRLILEKHPELVILGANNIEEIKKVQAKMAEDFNVISFDESKRVWKFKNKSITKNIPGKDRYDLIVKAFDDVPLYREIQKELKILKN